MQLVGCKAQIHDAKLREKDGCREQISSVGRKLLYEIHPRSGQDTANSWVVTLMHVPSWTKQTLDVNSNTLLSQLL
jgi:hypothetical protein